MAAPILARQMLEQGKKAIEADLFVVTRHYPAVLNKKGQVVEPAKDTELHVNAKAGLYVAGAGVLGAIALGIGWVAWNGIKVRNPIPIGDRVLTVLPGVKDSPPAWYTNAVDRHEKKKAERASRKKEAEEKRKAAQEAKEELERNRQNCLASGGTWTGTSCTYKEKHGQGTPKPPDPEVVRICNMSGGTMMIVGGEWKCVKP